MKSFTNLKQSKELAKILPLESADMYYLIKRDDCRVPWEEAAKDDTNVILFTREMMSGTLSDYKLPCWSLAALINILPADWWDCNKHCFFEIYKQQDDKQDESSILYIVRYFYYKEEDFNSKNPDFSRITHISTIGSNLIDACVEMIVELHKHKLLSIK